MAAKKVDPASIVSCDTFPDAQEAFHLLIEGSGADAALAACMLSLHFVTFESYQTHNAQVIGLAYIPYTDDQMLNWSTKGHADAIPELVSRLTDLKTMLIQLRARLPKTSAADQEVYENTKKLLIEAAHATLVNALINVTAGQEGFKNMANLPAYKAHKRVWNSIPEANTIEYFKHPFQAMLVSFADMFARKMTSSTVKHTSLNTSPDVEKDSIDEFTKVMDDASETSIKKQCPSIPALVDHLRTSQMVLYINAAVDNKNLRKKYCSSPCCRLPRNCAAFVCSAYSCYGRVDYNWYYYSPSSPSSPSSPPRYRQGWSCRGPCSYSSSLFSLQQNGPYAVKLSPTIDTGIYGD